MSELKALWIPTRSGNSLHCYLKDEADKVIAELKDDVAYWKKVAKKNMDDNVVMAKQRAEAFKRERRQKYKRCLAMAKWCLREYLNCDKYKITFWLKWRRRWMKLAEKIKEGDKCRG